MMMEVGYLDRVHRGEHQHAQHEKHTVLNQARQTQRIMLRIVGLSQAGEKNVKGTGQAGPPPTTVVTPKRQQKPRETQR
jgi:hypothetical protein